MKFSSLVDLLCGIETRRHVDREELGYSDEARFHYAPAEWRLIWRALRAVDIREGDRFVDLGCGKGRALCMASLFPFAHLTGVELSSELCTIARSNLKRFYGRPLSHTESIEIVCGDAADFALPADTSVVFFFNPFAGEVFERVLGNLEALASQRERGVQIIYVSPQLHERIASRPGVRELVPGSETLRVYEWKP